VKGIVIIRTLIQSQREGNCDHQDTYSESA
jgi:hypothetical protein